MNEPSDPEPSEPVLNVLAERYASQAMRNVWSQRGKVHLERDFWIAVMKAQRDLGRPDPGRGDQGLRAGQGADRPRVDREARARDAPRREGAHRGILGARQAAVHPPRAHQPRPDRERGAAADLPVAEDRPQEGGRGAPRVRAARGGVPRPHDHGAHAQRPGAADDARQAPRDVRPGAARSPSTASRA